MRMQPVATIHITGATATASMARNCTVARTGAVPAGSYDVTLGEALDIEESQVLVCPRGAAAVEVAIVHTSDTVKTVTTYDDTGALADFNTELTFCRVATGTAF